MWAEGTARAEALCREAETETVDVKTQRPREHWSSASSFSPGTRGSVLHPSLGRRSSGGPGGSGGGREASAAFVSGLWARRGRRAGRG